MIDMTLKQKLLKALEEAKGERNIHDFLKKEPFLVWATFMNCGGHSDYVVPEFSLGGKYYADFVVMQSFSGGWNIAFIELEPVDEKPFNKDGIPSKRLRGAIKQIDDWKNFKASETASLCSNLADAAKRRDTLYPEHNLAREPWCAEMPLRDPQTYLCCDYFIVMGRRSHFNKELMDVKAKFKSNHDVEILTYDRFIEVAEKLNKQNKHYNNRPIEKKDQKFLDKFAENPDQFFGSGNESSQTYPSELNIHGTNYQIQYDQENNDCVVNIFGTPYNIVEDRLTYRINRIEPDDLGVFVAENFDSLRAAIQFAEIYERFMYFHADYNTDQSLALLYKCNQFLTSYQP